MASATWVVTDEFVKDNSTGSVTASFVGTGEYESSASDPAATANFVTRTISAGTGAGIEVVDGTGAAATLTVNQTATLPAGRHNRGRYHRPDLRK